MLTVAPRLPALLPVLACFAVFACGGDKPPPPPPEKPPSRVEAELVAAADVNPDVSGRASPVGVRLYELSDATAFNTASFLALYQGDAAVLGPSLQARQELMLAPGESATVQRTIKPETRFVAVFAAFQEYDKAAWRAITDVAQNETTKLKISLGTLDIKIEKAKIEKPKPEKAKPEKKT